MKRTALFLTMLVANSACSDGTETSSDAATAGPSATSPGDTSTAQGEGAPTSSTTAAPANPPPAATTMTATPPSVPPEPEPDVTPPEPESEPEPSEPEPGPMNFPNPRPPMNSEPEPDSTQGGGDNGGFGGQSPSGGGDGGMSTMNGGNGGLQSSAGSGGAGGTSMSLEGCEDGPLDAPLPDCAPEFEESGDFYEDCVDRINQLRWECQCLPPLERWVEGEACADQHAQYDYEQGQAHAGISDGICENGGGSQNECPDYNPNFDIINFCLQQMWDEGPGEDFQAHGHYINMSSTTVTKVACGLYTTPEGDLWSVQNFTR